MRQPVESAGSISSKPATIREKADSITQGVTTSTQVAGQAPNSTRRATTSSPPAKTASRKA
jgi:hypothetical protein